MGIAERLHMPVSAFWSLPEVEQEDWRAHVEAERETCKFHHGPVSECDDDERDWFPQMVVCWPSAQLAAAQALYADQHMERPYHDGSFQSWSKERTRAYPFHYRDGVSMYLAPIEMDPDNQWLGSAGVDGPVGERPGVAADTDDAPHV